MSELKFCPCCNAGEHKIMSISDVKYCKECSNFFGFQDIELECPKCSKKNLTISDFPLPDGSIVFQCKSCKKMFSLTDVTEANKDILE